MIYPANFYTKLRVVHVEWEEEEGNNRGLDRGNSSRREVMGLCCKIIAVSEGKKKASSDSCGLFPFVWAAMMLHRVHAHTLPSQRGYCGGLVLSHKVLPWLVSELPVYLPSLLEVKQISGKIAQALIWGGILAKFSQILQKKGRHTLSGTDKRCTHVIIVLCLMSIFFYYKWSPAIMQLNAVSFLRELLTLLISCSFYLSLPCTYLFFLLCSSTKVWLSFFAPFVFHL